MTTTTFEEAKLCPKCGKPGDDRRATKSTDNRGKPVMVHMIYCVTTICPWFDSPWAVQVNADGSIPEAYQGLGEKKFVKASDETITRITESVQQQLDAETRPGGGELRNPRG